MKVTTKTNFFLSAICGLLFLPASASAQLIPVTTPGINPNAQQTQDIQNLWNSYNQWSQIFQQVDSARNTLVNKQLNPVQILSFYNGVSKANPLANLQASANASFFTIKNGTFVPGVAGDGRSGLSLELGKQLTAMGQSPANSFELTNHAISHAFLNADATTTAATRAESALKSVEAASIFAKNSVSSQSSLEALDKLTNTLSQLGNLQTYTNDAAYTQAQQTLFANLQILKAETHEFQKVDDEAQARRVVADLKATVYQKQDGVNPYPINVGGTVIAAKTGGTTPALPASLFPAP